MPTVNEMLLMTGEVLPALLFNWTPSSGCRASARERGVKAKRKAKCRARSAARQRQHCVCFFLLVCVHAAAFGVLMDGPTVAECALAMFVARSPVARHKNRKLPARQRNGS